MKKLLMLILSFDLLLAINPKAEPMAQLLVENILKSEKILGKNPRMDIKTYNIRNVVYHDRTEYNYTANEISQNEKAYRKDIESNYCMAFKLIKEKYDVEFVFNIFGRYGEKSFTHKLVCKN